MWVMRTDILDFDNKYEINNQYIFMSISRVSRDNDTSTAHDNVEQNIL